MAPPNDDNSHSDGPGRTVALSANLGFLWTDRPLPDAVAAAADAGFDAVECHFPYAVDPAAVRAALDDAGLAMVGLNTRPGDPAATDMGLAALADRVDEARAAIDEAVAYAAAIGCGHVHVMAGRTPSEPDGHAAARSTYLDNLAYATTEAAVVGVGILIEPINQRDMPGYHLSTVEDAAEVIASVGRHTGGPAPSIMFDCYHVQITQGDVLRRFEAHQALVGHVQFAGVPDRGEPDAGELHYPWLLPRLRVAGYQGPFGAEYRPRAGTEAGLGWMAAFEASSSSRPSRQNPPG